MLEKNSDIMKYCSHMNNFAVSNQFETRYEWSKTAVFNVELSSVHQHSEQFSSEQC